MRYRLAILLLFAAGTLVPTRAAEESSADGYLINKAGDVERQSYALGVRLTRRWDLQAEFRNDQQWFSADRNALLLIARYGF